MVQLWVLCLYLGFTLPRLENVKSEGKILHKNLPKIQSYCFGSVQVWTCSLLLEPWTGLEVQFKKFRFELRFWTELQQHYGKWLSCSLQQPILLGDTLRNCPSQATILRDELCHRLRHVLYYSIVLPLSLFFYIFNLTLILAEVLSYSFRTSC